LALEGKSLIELFKNFAAKHRGKLGFTWLTPTSRYTGRE